LSVTIAATPTFFVFQQLAHVPFQRMLHETPLTLQYPMGEMF